LAAFIELYWCYQSYITNMSSLFAAAKFGFFGFAAVAPQATYPGSPYELPKGAADEEPEQKGFRPYRSPPNPGKFEDLSKESKGKQ
jgi:hypothetical protein